MAKIKLENQKDYIHAVVSGKLTSSDITDKITPQIQAFFQGQNPPDAVLLNASEFEGWQDFSAFLKHMQLISEHHHQIDKIAMVGPKALQAVVLQLVGMLAVTHFEMFDTEDTAASWLRKLEMAA